MYRNSIDKNQIAYTVVGRRPEVRLRFATPLFIQLEQTSP
jgi:hypothetical protein